MLQPLLDQLWKAVQPALKPFAKLWEIVTRGYKAFTEFWDKATELASLVRDEITAWRSFQEAVPFRTGVISLPAAKKQTLAFIEQIRAAWAAIVDLAKQLKTQASGQTGDPAADARAAIEDIEQSGASGILKKLPKLAKGLEKVLAWLALIAGVMESVSAGIDDLIQIVETIKAVREEVETGSTVFLSQRNPRKTVRLRKGGSMKIRVGSLHPE